MKKTLHLFITLLCIHTAQANTTDSIAKAKQCFSDAHSQISQMLEGKEPLNYEKAIFLTENAFYQNAVNYDDYKAVLDYHTRNITAIAEANRNDENIKHNNNPLLSKEEKQELYNNVLYNWAIYTYLTDTTFFIDTTGIYFHLPYSYSKADPYGKNNFSNTQTIGLLIPQLRTGNCYALATLFKLFAERLHTRAQLATAPGHIYIRHRDINGTWYNVEPATGSFPGTGTISTVTYTTDKAIETGIALRTLNQEESINLCMIYLAKGYENKFKEAHSSFAMQCAETALKYDAKNLNAMLLKAEILESKLLTSNKTVAQLQSNATFKEYESLLTQLHALGYKQMPEDMRKYITATIQGGSTALPPIGNPQANGYASLSKGFLVEDIKEKKIEQYNHTLYNTKTNRITGFTPTKQEDVDVVFAMSVDPRWREYSDWSPYLFAGNDPIRLVDVDGEGPGDRIKAARNFLGKGIIYSQKEKENQGAELRTGKTKDALKYLDCSEFLCRVLNADNITTKVEQMTTKELKTFLSNEKKFEKSDKAKVGDIALWGEEIKDEAGNVTGWKGHAGIVSEVDEKGNVKIVHAAGAGKGVVENKYAIPAEKYRPDAKFLGFYRPKEETPDGKEIDEVPKVEPSAETTTNEKKP